MIQTIASVIFVAAFATAQTTTTSVPASCLPVTPVEDFNVTQYAAAPWYVQQQAVNAYTPLDRNRCVTAQYAIRDDAHAHWWERSWWGYTIDVLNYAETSNTSTGTSSSGASLCADSDKATPSQLTVAPCFLPQWLGGPYWVVAYREGDTDGYALVSGGQPRNVVENETHCGLQGKDPCCKTGDGINRSGLWILTRQRNPTDDSLVKEVRGIANQMGFSTAVLFNVTHDSDCRVPGIDDDKDNDDEEDEDDESGNSSTRVLRH